MSSVHGPRAKRGWALAGASAAMALAAGAAHADQLYGAGAIITDRSCPADVASCVTASGPAGPRLTANQIFGGAGGGVSTSFVTLPGSAAASAEVSFGADYLPTVRI